MAITKACCNIQDHTLHKQTAWADQRTDIEIDWRLARGMCTYSRAWRRLFGQSFMSSGMRPHSRQLPVDGQRHQCRLWATCLLPICGYLLRCTRTNALAPLGQNPKLQDLELEFTSGLGSAFIQQCGFRQWTRRSDVDSVSGPDLITESQWTRPHHGESRPP